MSLFIDYSEGIAYNEDMQMDCTQVRKGEILSAGICFKKVREVGGMTVEEIIHGESKNVEFKETPPKNTAKYTKTVIAYANTQGGKLFFGVADKTREIVGIDASILFQTMDSIANAVSDSCEPQIVPEIEPYTINGKTIIVVSVAPEPQRPYYLKSNGKEKGTYIRVGGTTRLASPEKIKELEMEGSKISWDELTCIGYPVTENAIKRLCRNMNTYRKEMQQRKNLAEKLPTVTRTNLENWKILKKTNEGYQASNAFALLTGTHFRNSKTQCAVFAGTNRGEFIDKQDYTGPLYEQVEAAYSFVLRNIRRSAKVEGLIRRESHELPPNAIREMIINAHCHRSFLEDSCVQVAIYDDRLEVTSPGGLCQGLTLEGALDGHSRLRNRAIAEVFNQMGLIEAWGNGLRSICKEAKEYELPAPEFIELSEMFRVNLYRKPLPVATRQSNDDMVKVGDNADESSVKFGDSSVKFGDITVNETQKKILSLIEENNQISAANIAGKLSLSIRAIEKNIKELREGGILVRYGAARGGYWEVRNN